MTDFAKILRQIPLLNDEERRLGERLIAGVPMEGAIGNGSLRQKLNCPNDVYWKVRNVLISYGLLETGRGRGGSVRRTSVSVEDASDSRPTADEWRREQDLYPVLAETLRNSFAKEKRYDLAHVGITGDYGKRGGGAGEHPDLVLGGFRVLPYIYGNQMDLFSFEVKFRQANVHDVYQAAHHRRFVHRAYLVVVCRADRNREEVSKVARETGVGLFEISDPKDFEEWDECVDPVRNTPDPSRMNDFLASRVPYGFREQWREWLRVAPNAMVPIG